MKEQSEDSNSGNLAPESKRIAFNTTCLTHVRTCLTLKFSERVSIEGEALGDWHLCPLLSEGLWPQQRAGKHLPLFIQRTGGTGREMVRARWEAMGAELPIRVGVESGKGGGPLPQGLLVTAIFLHIRRTGAEWDGEGRSAAP